MWDPWFEWLPFQPARGELLTLRIGRTLPQVIVNAGRWLIPRGSGIYLFGTTYNRNNFNEEVTASARKELEEYLPTLFNKRVPHYRGMEQRAATVTT